MTSPLGNEGIFVLNFYIHKQRRLFRIGMCSKTQWLKKKNY